MTDTKKPSINASSARGDDDGGCKTALVLATENPEDAAILQSNDLGKKLEQWRDDSASAAIRFVMLLAMLRPEPRIDEIENRRFLAMDGSFYPKAAFEESEENQKYWENRLANLRPASLEFIKSGPEIFAALDIRVSEEETRKLMRMKKIDPATTKAVHSALWSAQNTSRKPVDMDTALFVLQTFTHEHPAFAEYVDNNGKHYSPAYGEATLYGLLKKPKQDVGHPGDDHPSDGSVDDADLDLNGLPSNDDHEA